MAIIKFQSLLTKVISNNQKKHYIQTILPPPNKTNKGNEAAAQIARTGRDAVSVVGNSYGGMAVTTFGAATAITTGDDKMLKSGLTTLQSANSKVMDMFVGKGQIIISAEANISKPYNIIFNSVDADIKVLQGVIGTFADTFLMVLKPQLQQLARYEVARILENIVENVRTELMKVPFVGKDKDNLQLNKKKPIYLPSKHIQTKNREFVTKEKIIELRQLLRKCNNDRLEIKNGVQRIFNMNLNDFGLKNAQKMIEDGILDKILEIWAENKNNEIEYFNQVMDNVMKQEKRQIDVNDEKTQNLLNMGINGLIEAAWKPKNLYCKFIGSNQIYITLKCGVMKLLNKQIKFEHETSVIIRKKRLKCEIGVDTEKAIFSARVIGIKSLLNHAVIPKIKRQIMKAIGNGCYDCNVLIIPSNEDLGIRANASLRIPV